MPFEVAAGIVGAISAPGETVVDPMMGSGSTLRAAASLGRNAAGFDMDPLAVLLARAYCQPLAADDLRLLGTEVLAVARELEASTTLDGFLAALGDEEDAKFLRYWFPEGGCHKLFCLARAMREVVGESPIPTLGALFSSTIISRGASASYAKDLSRSRPHKVTGEPVRDPFAAWQAKLKEFVRFSEEHVPAGGNLGFRLGDGRDMPIDDGEVDALVTSPPYLVAIDYIRTSKFSLVFLGHHLAQLREVRKASVGTETGLTVPLADGEVERLVAQGVSDPKRVPVVRRYLQDMLDALREAHRVLKRGGRAIYVVGPSILSRSRYDGGETVGLLAERAGFTFIGAARRDLSEANRSLPPPRRNARSQAINQRMTCELYVGLVKS